VLIRAFLDASKVANSNEVKNVLFKDWGVGLKTA